MSSLSEQILRGDYDADSSTDKDEISNVVIRAAIELHIAGKRRRKSKYGGSTIGRQVIDRNREAGNQQLISDYFAENPVFPATHFRRRFRINRPLFLRILNAIQQHDDYFVQKADALRNLGLSGPQKMTVSMRMLAYGLSADLMDEYCRVGESTTIEAVKRFCKEIIAIYEPEYLRSPNAADISRLLEVGERRGFPGMLGSLDCMHRQWKNCPTAYHGQYTGHVHKPTIILEAVASYDLWIWHAFFGMPGSHNNINVLDRSPLFADLANGRAPPANYVINGHQYTMGYYLTDGIYLPWATLVQTISAPVGASKKLFSKMQEKYQKDVERAFGVLQARFAIVKMPARLWNHEDLSNIMKACVILHNMIVENEHEDTSIDYEYHTLSEVGPPIEVSRESTLPLREFLHRRRMIRSPEIHHQLRNDLVKHLWSREEDI